MKKNLFLRHKWFTRVFTLRLSFLPILSLVLLESCLEFQNPTIPIYQEYINTSTSTKKTKQSDNSKNAQKEQTDINPSIVIEQPNTEKDNLLLSSDEPTIRPKCVSTNKNNNQESIQQAASDQEFCFDKHVNHLPYSTHNNTPTKSSFQVVAPIKLQNSQIVAKEKILQLSQHTAKQVQDQLSTLEIGTNARKKIIQLLVAREVLAIDKALADEDLVWITLTKKNTLSIHVSYIEQQGNLDPTNFTNHSVEVDKLRKEIIAILLRLRAVVSPGSNIEIISEDINANKEYIVNIITPKQADKTVNRNGEIVVQFRAKEYKELIQTNQYKLVEEKENIKPVFKGELDKGNNKKKEGHNNVDNEDNIEEELSNKVFKLLHGHEVSFYKEQGKWKADVTHVGKHLSVVIEPGMSLVQLLRLNIRLYGKYIHIIKPDQHTNKEGIVIIGNYAGLLGGGEDGKKREFHDKDEINKKETSSVANKRPKLDSHETQSTASSSSSQSSEYSLGEEEAFDGGGSSKREESSSEGFRPYSPTDMPDSEYERAFKTDATYILTQEALNIESSNVEEDKFNSNEGSLFTIGETIITPKETEIEQAKKIAEEKLEEAIAAAAAAKIELTKAKEATTLPAAQAAAEETDKAARQIEKAIIEVEEAAKSIARYAEKLSQEGKGEEVKKVEKLIEETIKSIKVAAENAIESKIAAYKVVDRKRLVEQAKGVVTAVYKIATVAAKRIQISDEAAVAVAVASNEAIKLIEIATKRIVDAVTAEEQEEEKQTAEKVKATAKTILKTAVTAIEKALEDLGKYAKTVNQAIKKAARLQAEIEYLAAIRAAIGTGKSIRKILGAIELVQKAVGLTEYVELTAKTEELVEKIKSVKKQVKINELEKIKAKLEAKLEEIRKVEEKKKQAQAAAVVKNLKRKNTKPKDLTYVPVLDQKILAKEKEERLEKARQTLDENYLTPGENPKDAINRYTTEVFTEI
ncbi:MAG: hypothetical protein ACYC2U_07860, partial [Candidatus Amoebophilus sp.]